MLENADQNNSKYEHFLRSVLNEFKQIFETIPNNFYLRRTLLFKDFWDNNLDLFIPLIQWQINTAQKMKFSIKDFFSKCDQIGSFLRIWSHLLKESAMEDFIFCEVWYAKYNAHCRKIFHKRNNVTAETSIYLSRHD